MTKAETIQPNGRDTRLDDRIPVRVAAIESLRSGVKRFTLVAIDRERLPAFSGGSHIVVHLSDGASTWRNSYSLTSAPSETRFYQIAVRKEAPSRSKGGSIFLHDRVVEGDTVSIEAPANFFPLSSHGRKHIFIGGGIGITPFMSHLAALNRMDVDYELHYAFRDEAGAVFSRMIEAEHGTKLNFYDSSIGERLNPVSILADQPLGTHVYVCGPHSLIDAVVQSARDSGWPELGIHFEEFTPAPPEHATPFIAELPGLGTTVPVDGGHSLLEALERAGLSVPSSCRVGRCGTCEIQVLDGEPDHRDRCLTDAERSAGRMLACVSRARGDRLVLEVART